MEPAKTKIGQSRFEIWFGTVVDQWRVDNKDVTINELLKVLETLRIKLLNERTKH